MRRCIRCSSPSGLPLLRRTCFMCAGRMSLDSTSENNSTGITINGICANKGPRSPPIINKGMKAATVVKTPKVTGTAISCVPLIAASVALSLSLSFEKIFSPVTMASSTTIPSTRIKANRLTRLKVTPSTGISANAPRKLMGIPMDTHTATEKRRNSVSSRKIKIPPWKALFSKVCRRSFTYWERSRQ